MNKEKIISKGYTLSVVSWENDADNYKTKKMIFESKELAIAVARMCTDIFQSKNSGHPKGIGNSSDARGDVQRAKDIIVEYMECHPEIYPDKTNPSDEDLINICMEYNNNLLGGSEFYFSRVLESATLTFSPDDVFLEKIEF